VTPKTYNKNGPAMLLARFLFIAPEDASYRLNCPVAARILPA